MSLVETICHCLGCFYFLNEAAVEQDCVLGLKYINAKLPVSYI